MRKLGGCILVDMSSTRNQADRRRIVVCLSFLLLSLIVAAVAVSWPYTRRFAAELFVDGESTDANGRSARSEVCGRSGNSRPPSRCGTESNSNRPDNRTPDLRQDPPPLASIEVYVDFRIKLPDCPKAVGWKAITSQSYGQVRAIGAEVLSGLPVGMKAPTVSDGYATYGGMLKLKVTQESGYHRPAWRASGCRRASYYLKKDVWSTPRTSARGSRAVAVDSLARRRMRHTVPSSPAL